jgi:hypothetical protein
MLGQGLTPLTVHAPAIYNVIVFYENASKHDFGVRAFPHR